MRRDYAAFRARDVEVLVIAPDAPDALADHWRRHELPFPGLADPEHTVARLYRQAGGLLTLGRVPTLVLVDREGRVRYRHDARSMADLPANADLLAIIDDLG